jgi:hypothetical protein
VLDAAAYAASRGIKVDLLVTMDPVDGPIRLGNKVTPENWPAIRKQVGGRWMNVRATAYETHPAGRGDWFASRGGRFDKVAQSHADVHLDVPVHHERFGAMADAVDLQKVIEEVYHPRKLKR